jgi:hypothetical protein
VKEFVMTMQAQEFSPATYSLNPVALIPPDAEDDEPVDEVDERLARYARLGKLVDVEDVIEVVLSRLRESGQLRCLVEDSIEDPHQDITRPKVYVSELIRMGQQVLDAVAVAVDEQVAMLDVVEG